MTFTPDRPVLRLPAMSRRILLAAPALILGLHEVAAEVIPTPSQTRGPFYPASRPTDSDLDLTRVTGRPARAEGEVIEIVGRVISARSGPVPRAVVEIWQADNQGRYHHPDESAGDADPNFQGFGAVRCSASGDYFFRTVRPRYYGQGRAMRTPHVHFRVVAPGQPELVTQMYFPGEAMNARDGLFRRLRSDAARDALTARRVSGSPPRYRFEIVLG